MKIGELAHKTKLSTSAIRYYEQIGLIPYAERQSGQRVYDESTVTRLQFITLAKTTGFTLEEIFELLDPSKDQVSWRAKVERKVREFETVINEHKLMQATLEAFLECSCSEEGLAGLERRLAQTAV